MAINYYPPCPAPDLTYGLPAHTDPNALTILLQDSDVAGLQVLKKGKWIKVDPHPGAFVVNIGDQLQVSLNLQVRLLCFRAYVSVDFQALSNGVYKSVWHRAVVNTAKARLSVASFLAPCNTVEIRAPEKLTSGEAGAVYRSYTYDEYYKTFWSRNLDQEHCLETFKC